MASSTTPEAAARRRAGGAAATLGAEPEVVARVHPNGLAVLRLNRPRALNALTLGMVRAARARLEEWRLDEAVRAVLLVGTGGRALCAGGDIRSLVDERRPGFAAQFFREEYQLDHAVGTYPKPYVALLDGIVMGGGVGLSVHGDFRVSTDRTTFAMPETGIGLFPDVGATLVLGRLGGLGQYLGLAGARLKAADCVHAGIATHHVPAARVPGLREALATRPLDGGRAAVAAVLAEFAADPGEAPLARVRDAAERAFGAPRASIEDVLDGLREEAAGGDPAAAKWAQATLRTLAAKSPTSLRLTFRALREARHLTLAEALRREYRLAVRVTSPPRDFREGVRAVIVDKDNRPAWSPSKLSGVTPALVDRHFAPFSTSEGVAELQLP